jgi:hypothetical protein
VTEQELAEIRAEVFAASMQRDPYYRGERHWRAVAHAGLHRGAVIQVVT